MCTSTMARARNFGIIYWGTGTGGIWATTRIHSRHGILMRYGRRSVVSGERQRSWIYYWSTGDSWMTIERAGKSGIESILGSCWSWRKRWRTGDNWWQGRIISLQCWGLDSQIKVLTLIGDWNWETRSDSKCWEREGLTWRRRIWNKTSKFIRDFLITIWHWFIAERIFFEIWERRVVISI